MESITAVATAGLSLWCRCSAHEPRSPITLLIMENITMIATAGLSLTCAIVKSRDFPFIFLFIFRYLRLIVHIFSFQLYKPTPVPDHPTVHPSDCTVIIPTVEPTNPDFVECLTSVLVNDPGAIIIVTVGKENLRTTRAICSQFKTEKIKVLQTNIANKRYQVCHTFPSIRTKVTVLVDDHVFWPSTRFLRTLLAPMEDPQVGVVGSNKRVRRLNHGYSFRDFWNFIGCLYLERHNFEIAATSNLDGGVFVISGRTSAHRTRILQDPDFISGFINERFFFGMFGPLNADDDNFITRWEVRHGWKIAIQYSQDAMIETTLGTYPKFMSQCLRWVRTTWRSNSASLFTDRTVWKRQPWCVYAVYISSFFNFALFYDAALIYFLMHASFGDRTTIKYLGLWVFASKLVKPFPHFWRNPGDVFWLPGYILFGYYHSLIKLYAGLTFWVTAWGGRTLQNAEDSEDDWDDGDDWDDWDDEDQGNFDNNDILTDPCFVPDSPDTNDSFSFNAGSHTTYRRAPSGRAKQVRTPLATIGSDSAHLIADDVLEPQTPQASLAWSRNVKDVIQQPWIRGKKCARLHSKGRNTLRKCCGL